MNPYVDPATGTHYNKLGITDPALLREAEYAITRLRIAELRLDPIPGKFDLEHFRQVHHHVFQDVYPWAGQVRTLNFSKRDPKDPGWTTPFAPASRIEELAGYIEEGLKKRDYLKGLDRAAFADQVADLYVAMNHLHPFPEGNGRSTQTLLSQLADQAGHRLDFGKVTSLEWNTAAARSMAQRHREQPAITRAGDTRLIKAVFAKIVVPVATLQEQRDTGATGVEPQKNDAKQRLVVMNGERTLQRIDGAGKWQPASVLGPSNGIKPGIYNLYAATDADRHRVHDGVILHVDGKHVFQNTARGCIRHPREAFAALPDVGSVKRMTYGPTGLITAEAPPLSVTRGYSR